MGSLVTNSREKHDERIKQLADELLRLRALYYQGTPLISDQEYDRCEDELRLLDPDHPVLYAVGTLVETSSRAKVSHQVPMLSLAKTYVLEDLLAWAAGKEVVGTLKIDGVSLSLLYRNAQLYCAKTRGNGLVGEEVSEKTRWISDCLPSLRLNVDHRQEEISLVSSDCEIRGELYCSQSQFSLLLHEMHQLGLPLPSSQRNIVAGILGRKQHHQLARFFSFDAFDFLSFSAEKQPFQHENEKLEFIARLGFKPPFFRHLTNAGEITSFLGEVQDKINEGDLGSDGAVFAFNDCREQAALGNTSHHPRYKLAFKWQGETAVATIKRITWQTSRLGVVTPVATISPVQLSGASITRVTLHNAAYVKNLAFGVGDTIRLVRSGEVIPKVVEKLSSGGEQLSLPQECPSCAQPLEFDGVRLQCENEVSCSAQQLGRVLNWIRAVGIEDLSEKRLEALVAAGLLTKITDLYRLRREDFLTVPLIKEKMADKLFAAIQGSKQVELAAFLQGLGIKGMGKRSWQELLLHHPRLDQLRALSVEDICRISGFAAKTAEQLRSGLKANSQTITELLALGVNPQVPASPGSAGFLPWSGKIFALTGTLSRGRKEIIALIEEQGGKIAASVSGQTYALIIADPRSNSEKAVKARSLGVALWSEEMLFEEIANGNK